MKQGVHICNGKTPLAAGHEVLVCFHSDAVTMVRPRTGTGLSARIGRDSPEATRCGEVLALASPAN